MLVKLRLLLDVPLVLRRTVSPFVGFTTPDGLFLAITSGSGAILGDLPDGELPTEGLSFNIPFFSVC